METSNLVFSASPTFLPRGMRTQAKPQKELTKDQKTAKKIKDALYTYAGIDTSEVKVIIRNDSVLLDGRVSTLEQVRDADNIVQIVMKSPIKVDNNLQVNAEYADEY